MRQILPVILIGIVFGLVGMGYQDSLARLLGFTIVLLFLVWDLLQQQEIRFPRLYFEHLLFLMMFGISIWWSLDQGTTIDYWLLFATMPAVWLLAFNHREWVKRYFFILMVFLGIFFLIGTVLTHTVPAFSNLRTTPRGLIGSYSVNSDHYMLGDFWAVVWVTAVARYLKTKQRWLWPLLMLGIPIILFSLSRSALVAAAFAMWVMVDSSNDVTPFWRRLFWGVVGMATLYMATQKPVIMNRPYYVQSIAGLFGYPFGVGVGNFEVVSSDPRFHILGLSGYSKVTHSILLEFLSGMGILVVVWWEWCRRFWVAFLEKATMDEYRLGLLALVINMIFNPTYFVTTMWWLVGVFMAIMGTREKSNVKIRVNSGVTFILCMMVLLLGLWRGI